MKPLQSRCEPPSTTGRGAPEPASGETGPEPQDGTPAGADLTRTSLHVIDPDEEELFFLCDFLSIPGYRVTGSSKPDAALQCISRLRPQVVVSNLVASWADTLDFLMRIKGVLPGTRVLLISENGNLWKYREVRRLGGDDLLIRPLNAIQLLRAVQRLVEGVPSSWAARRTPRAKGRAPGPARRPEGMGSTAIGGPPTRDGWSGSEPAE